MTIPELNDLQVDALTSAAKYGVLIQIQPNQSMDSPEIFEVWTKRISDVSKLAELELLKELPLENEPTIEQLKTQYPGRTFRVFAATEVAVLMFNDAGKRTIN
jgi:hypothetical protein